MSMVKLSRENDGEGRGGMEGASKRKQAADSTYYRIDRSFKSDWEREDIQSWTIIDCSPYSKSGMDDGCSMDDAHLYQQWEQCISMDEKTSSYTVPRDSSWPDKTWTMKQLCLSLSERSIFLQMLLLSHCT